MVKLPSIDGWVNSDVICLSRMISFAEQGQTANVHFSFLYLAMILLKMVCA